jgi:hypothetical protein
VDELYAQKYPREVPNAFRVPYYQPAIAGIRGYYRRGNSPQELANARAKLAELSPPHRRKNLGRVLDAFKRSRQSRRILAPRPHARVEVSLHGADLRLRFDLAAADRKGDVFILYNCKVAAIDSEVARSIVEVSHWAMEATGKPVPFGRIELVDLAADKVYRANAIRKRTMKAAEQTAQAIETLWPSI